ncbi:MAG: DUF1552 domain-containing protein [Deltaproteobacteria bacterium]|nr:DUF1552 domain-containing protein [Deltaproteobacteria bacterium]
MKRSWMINRRALLRGAGVALALPALDVMAAQKRGAAMTRPNRFAVVYTPNGVNMSQWFPSAPMRDELQLSPSLSPLSKWKRHTLVFSGLGHENARRPEDRDGDHSRGLCSYLTGVHVQQRFDVIKAGVSLDQLIAQTVGEKTRLPSLELAIDPNRGGQNCDSYPCAYMNLSWKNSELPLPRERDPKAVFDRLFNVGMDPARDRLRRSILDFVGAEIQQLSGKVSASDAVRLDEYFTGVREIEQRLARLESFGPLARPPLVPPDEVPDEFVPHVELMMDLMVLAFTADITRVASFMVANENSNRPYPWIGITDGHHDMSHHQHRSERQEKVAKIDQYHVSLLARMMERMAAVKEGSHTLLDNSMVLYGASIADGDNHEHYPLPVVLAGGGAGTIRSGRHLHLREKTPLCNLLLALGQRMGVNATQFGDSTGALPLV